MTPRLQNIQKQLQYAKSGVIALPMAAQVVLGVCTSLVLALSLVALFKLASYWAGNLDRIDDAGFRLGRLQGYVESEAKFVKAANEAQSMASRMAFPDSGESGRGGALLQQNVRQLAGEAGLTITGSELRTPEDMGALTKMSVGLTVNGNPAQFIEFLRQVNANKPLLFVESINLSNGIRRAVRGRTNDNVLLDAELSVSAFRLSSDGGDDDSE